MRRIFRSIDIPTTNSNITRPDHLNEQVSSEEIFQFVSFFSFRFVYVGQFRLRAQIHSAQFSIVEQNLKLIAQIVFSVFVS